jgi:uncharacterized protein VirK/YbjX
VVVVWWVGVVGVVVGVWGGLLYKLYHPYLTRSLCMRRRRELLAYHYAFVGRQGLGPLVLQAARRPQLLASVMGRDEQHYDIVLQVGWYLEREGELVLQLVRGEAAVYSLAFSFTLQDGQPALSIGCLQGPNCGQGLEANREATRALHGIRPKQLLVTLAQQIGHALGCAGMRLVGNDNRVVLSAMRQGKVKADYDQLWREMGAEPADDGDYRLGCAVLPEPDMAEIASNKRSQARRRHQVVSELADAVVQAVRQRR